jgi:hypothetical protein
MLCTRRCRYVVPLSFLANLVYFAADEVASQMEVPSVARA